MASSLGTQSWTDCDTKDLLYSHAVLLSLAPLNLLDPVEGREQNKQGTGPAQYVYSAMVVFVHPTQTLIPIMEGVNFLKVCHDDIVHEGCSCGWCILCKMPSYETSRFFPMIPHMPHLALQVSSSSVDPSVLPMLCLDLSGCEADDLYIWLLHTIWRNDTEYTILPPALRPSHIIPWELRMEETLKLWQNTTYETWKVGAPGQDVGLVLMVVTTSHKEYEHRRMVMDISNEALIQYPASNLDDDDGEDNVEDSNEPLQDMLVGGEGEDDSDDDEDVDYDVRQMALKVANKTDDSGFRSSIERSNKIKALVGIGTQWTSATPRYQLGVSAGSSSFQSSHPVGQFSTSNIASGISFNQFVQRTAQRSGVSELIGGQALLKDHTYPEELEELWKLANKQLAIAHHFDTKFSNMAFTLLQKMQQMFVGMGE